MTCEDDFETTGQKWQGAQPTDDIVARLIARLTEERDELRHLIETGASRGAEISPFVRRIFSAGSQAAKDRDEAQMQIARLTEEKEQIMLLYDGKCEEVSETEAHIKMLTEERDRLRVALVMAEDCDRHDRPGCGCWIADARAALHPVTGDHPPIQSHGVTGEEA